MTNKEAIKGLKALSKEFSGYKPNEEMFDMAIKALELVTINSDSNEIKVTNCNYKDTIYRQAAIDALDVLCQEHRYRIPGKRETYSQYNEAWQDALDRAEGAIGNLPSVQPEVKPIEYRGCANAMLRMWMDNVITDGEYNRIMDKLNAHWRVENG